MKVVQVILNIVLIGGGFVISFVLRYGLPLPEKNFQPYKESFAFLTLLYVLSLLHTGVFRRRFRTYWHLFQKIAAGVLTGTLLSIVFIYLLRVRWASFPSSVFAINLPVTVILLFIANSLLLRMQNLIVKKVVVLGDENFLDPFGSSESLVEVKHIHRIGELLNCSDIDEVVICNRIYDESQLNLLIYLLNKLKVVVTFSPVLYAELLSDSAENENSLQYIATSLGRKTDVEEFFIRLLDVVGAVILLLFTAIPMVLIAIAIKLTSRGPILYKQVRMGKDGKEFVLSKFRTMVLDAEAKTGPVLASRGDPRITSIGRFLRSCRLDELPQLFNVIAGTMSLVGPRPERPHFVKIHKTLRGTRLAVRPGLTGLAQVRKAANAYDLHPKHKIKYDYLYIQKRSLFLNVYILLKTIPVILMRNGQ